MTKAPTLESRIARIAENYGDGTLRAYATEAGEAQAQIDRLRNPWRKAGLILWGAFCGGIGGLIVQVAWHMGWL